MSRPQGHRKSQSTSALSVLASQPQSSSSSSTNIPSTPSRSSFRIQEHDTKTRYRSSRPPHAQLPSVHESEPQGSTSASMAYLPGLSDGEGMRRTRSNQSSSSSHVPTSGGGRSKSKSSSGAEVLRREKVMQEEGSGMGMRRERSGGDEGLEGWLSDIKSLRSSSRRRLSALKNLEKYLVECCISGNTSNLENLISKQIYQILLSLLTRHTSTLSQRSSHTSLPANDELAISLIPEIGVVVSILQGLCCLSRGCKDAVGENWVMEMFIDLLLLLRAQPAISESFKPIAYIILEMLFCVLVDSPKNARTYEKLGGLEAVVRVLKGTGVTKDVRMKCIEFLYFYLLPEQNEPQRAVSSSSSSSSSSNESTLFPPSPLSTSQNSIDLPKISDPSTGRISPSSNHPKELADIDMPFVPMTPRKAPQPNLGYLTPATRKSSVCASNSSTPSLPTVPASPRVPISQSSTSRGLAAMLDEMDTSSIATPRSSRSNVTTGGDDKSGVGLGLGLPKSTSGLVRSNTTQTDLPTLTGESTRMDSPGFIDPFNMTSSSASERSHSNSSSSTIVPISASRNISRSNTQPSLTLTDHNGLPRSPSNISTSSGTGTGSIRRISVRRVSKSPLIQSNLPESTSESGPPTSSSSTCGGGPRTPKIRHSRTQAHLSGIPPNHGVPPVPPLPIPSTPSTVSNDKEKNTRTPSAKSRAFPAELTRGIPPSISSPSLGSGGVTPLGASKRIPSDRRRPASLRRDKDMDKGKMGDEKRRVRDVKSVEEKKEMLGMWLGNVDQLVQGVEKVSFWGSIGSRAKER